MRDRYFYSNSSTIWFIWILVDAPESLEIEPTKNRTVNCITVSVMRPFTKATALTFLLVWRITGTNKGQDTIKKSEIIRA